MKFGKIQMSKKIRCL